MQTRFSFGGDEHIFAEVDESMSLEFFQEPIHHQCGTRRQDQGVTEICPANASYQGEVRSGPDQAR